MTERDWQKDWELCKKATPGPWKVSCLMGDTRIVATDLCGNSRGLVAKIPDGRHWPYSSTNAEFIAEAREALPYWLQRVWELERAIKSFVEVCELAERTGVWVVMTPVMWDAFEELRKKVIKTK